MFPIPKERKKMLKPEFECEYGYAYTVKADDILYVPFLKAKEEGKGLGKKLLSELEQSVIDDPELKEIALPTIVNPRLLTIVLQRGYELRKEFSAEFGEFVEIFYKTFN